MASAKLIGFLEKSLNILINTEGNIPGMEALCKFLVQEEFCNCCGVYLEREGQKGTEFFDDPCGLRRESNSFSGRTDWYKADYLQQEPSILIKIQDDRKLNSIFKEKLSGIDQSIAMVSFAKGEMRGVMGVCLDTDSEIFGKFEVLQSLGNLVGDLLEKDYRKDQGLKNLADENQKLREMIDHKPGKLVGKSSEMQEVYKQIHLCADSSAIVLLRGHSGTGKETVARAIAEESDRKEKTFIIFNGTGLSETLLEGELFGYERGAFTGATSRHIGRIEAANGGTLFIDEVGLLPLPVQTKLLRFIQDKTFTRMGSNIEQRSDIRLIVGTRMNLEEMMEQQKFREDLYYRLNIFQIVLPDLAQRKSDILLLAEHFIEQNNLKYGKHILRLSTPAINMLMSYHWPGNVRELESCIEHATLIAEDDCIHAYNLPPSLQTDSVSGTAILPDSKIPLDVLLDSYERELLSEALKRHNGNMSAAGRELCISPRTMHYKIHRLGIEPEALTNEAVKS